jgi:uncharacterized protein YbaR (Trm112 family)
VALDKRILDLLVCPVCKGDLDYEEEKSRLVCKACKLAYPVKEDIPVMLEDQAERLD